MAGSSLRNLAMSLAEGKTLPVFADRLKSYSPGEERDYALPRTSRVGFRAGAVHRVNRSFRRPASAMGRLDPKLWKAVVDRVAKHLRLSVNCFGFLDPVHFLSA